VECNRRHKFLGKEEICENLASKLPENLVFEGYQRFWVYDTLKDYGKMSVYGTMKYP
jgi:hypothetical protein